MHPGQSASSEPQAVKGARHHVRVILAHDYLIQMGGAERLFASMHRAWPGAPIYVSATDHDHLLPDFNDAEIHNTWMQRLPGLRAHHKKLFLVSPFAFRSCGRLGADDAVVGSSGLSKWRRFRPRTGVVCSCHTSPLVFWQAEHCLKDEVQNHALTALKAFARLFILRLRPGDLARSKKVNHFIAAIQNHVHEQMTVPPPRLP